MRPTAHVSSAIIVSFMFYHFLEIQDSRLFTIFILASLLVDIDFLLVPFLQEKNHRRYITHHPFFWVLLLIISFLISNMYLIFVSLGGLFHLLLDTFDFGLQITEDITSTWHLISVDQSFVTEDDFRQSYWGNGLLLSFELLSFILSIFILIFEDKIPSYTVLATFILATFYSILEIVKIQSNGN